MIIVWPLIVSKTVNPNILPGVCKALEKYIYVHELDRVIEAANTNIKENRKKSDRYTFIKAVGGALRLESTDVDPFNYIEEKDKQTTQTFDVDPNTGARTATSVQVRDNPPERDTYKDQYDTAKAKDDYRKFAGEAPNIGRVDSSAINTEPTWNTVYDQQGRTSAIGVKVVPFIIQNEQSLIRLMTSDRYRSALSRDLHVQARWLLKLMHRVANKTWKATIGTFLSWTGFVSKDLESGTITQNWKNDIILQNTTFKDQMFVLLNKMDLEDDFLHSAQGVKKLFSLGWTSFVVADDMNKVVNFCMKTYKGMCSMVNYGFLYSDSRSHHQVYKDIDEISSRSGPLFRLKNRRKTMITDNLAKQKLDLYSVNSMLSELDLSIIGKKVKDNPAFIVSNVKSIVSALKRNDVKTVYNIVKKFNPTNKKVDLNKIVNDLSKESSLFKKNYDLSYMVFKNSLPKLNEEALVAGTILYAGIISLNKDKNYNIKNDLKKIVASTRNNVKTQDEDNDDFSKDLTIAFSFAILTVTMTIGAATAAIYALIVTAPTLAPFAITVLIWSSILLVLYTLCRIILSKPED